MIAFAIALAVAFPLTYLVVVAACIPAAQPQRAAPPPSLRQSAARSLGYPTRKSAADLDAMVAEQTKNFTRTTQHAEGRLEAPAPFVIEGAEGNCYTVVMRLGDGATWGDGAEAGVRFDFRSPTGPGSGGPGVTGPGAVASVGCAEATGPITVTMAPLIGAGDIGQGPFSVEVWSQQL